MSQRCNECQKDVFFCECPPPAKPARPAWQETYPPLYCIACGSPVFRLPLMKMTITQVTCSEHCKQEIDKRYYRGSVMQRPYQET